MSEPCSLLWLDIETTGLDRKKDYLLEVACFVTDPNGDSPRDERVWVIQPKDRLWQSVMIPFVRDMHSKSNLIHDVNEIGISQNLWIEEFHDYLQRTLEKGTTVGHKLTMAGSGVGPFDLPFILENFPVVTPFFNYYVMDVGVVGRFYNHVLGRERPASENLSHRAMDDIKDHYREFMDYRKMIENE